MRILFSILLIVFSIQKGGAQNKPLKIGESAPAIALPAVNGDTLSLSSLKGKLVLIDFWATWCSPCVEEQPVLKSIYEKFGNKVKEGKFEILGVSLDKSKDNWQKGIDQLQITWPQISDLKFWKSPVAKDYGIEGLPFNVIINEKGKIVAINLHGKALETFISNYLKKM
ncbi:TlpA family protein disulfide reductase [Chitinophaga silvatica]|uniref:TlpA family protein disulfide reductase n=1 Tax=Chitinophaga silvatica TaxID=2282649 RepID=A0A3E1Y923_9BACT|nr:TlpA disulfide reductase family protein [Chitinophaga silvatica]RFS21907.1 TlpA family protein disulfide reductase [Chitinophaga silvatica]